jgi:hypothetical protein
MNSKLSFNACLQVFWKSDFILDCQFSLRNHHLGKCGCCLKSGMFCSLHLAVERSYVTADFGQSGTSFEVRVSAVLQHC